MARSSPGRLSAGLGAFAAILFGFAALHIIILRTYTVAGFVVFLLLGLALQVVSLRLRSATAQTALGVAAGMALWSAAGEVGDTIGINTRVEPSNWPFILIFLVYLALKRETRCPFLHRAKGWLGIPSLALGDSANWGPTTAFELFILTWAGHVTLLAAYYLPELGPNSWFTYTVFVGATLAGLYLLYHLVQVNNWASALRYAIPTVIVCWTPVEILTKWAVLPVPFVAMKPVWSVVVMLIALLLTLRSRRQARTRLA